MGISKVYYNGSFLKCNIISWIENVNFAGFFCMMFVSSFLCIKKKVNFICFSKVTFSFDFHSGKKYIPSTRQTAVNRFHRTSNAFWALLCKGNTSFTILQNSKAICFLFQPLKHYDDKYNLIFANNSCLKIWFFFY